MTWSIEFIAHILIMLLDTLHLVSSCSSHRAALFGCILSCSRRWFDHYSSLTSIFESLLEKYETESGSLVHLWRRSESYLSLRILEPWASLCFTYVPFGGLSLLFSRVHFSPLTFHTFFSFSCSYSLHSWTLPKRGIFVDLLRWGHFFFCFLIFFFLIPLFFLPPRGWAVLGS